MPTCVMASGIKIPTIPAGLNLRYFNQPIDLIPGYTPDTPQVLCHATGAFAADYPTNGLFWANFKCQKVVTHVYCETETTQDSNGNDVSTSYLKYDYDYIPVFTNFRDPETQFNRIAILTGCSTPSTTNPDTGGSTPPSSSP